MLQATFTNRGALFQCVVKNKRISQAAPHKVMTSSY